MVELATLRPALATELAVLEKLGEGGEGEVFLCRLDPPEERAGEGSRLVALKLLKDGRRAQLASVLELRHPRIVTVLGTGEVLGRTYVLMEYFPGKPLRSRLAGRPLSELDLRAVFLAIAEALEHAHGRGVVHMDVKPENVLVAEGPGGLDVKLADFGLAAELREAERRALLASRSLRSVQEDELRTLAGTLPYLAPERLDEERPEPRATIDVYSLGVLLFEALTGRTPAGLELPSELRPEIDDRWDRIVKRALARDPRRRHPTIAALREDVFAILAPPAPIPPPPPLAKPPKAKGEAMVVIPSGWFRMGEGSSPDARPVRQVTLPAFAIDRTPVTNAAYLAFVLATGTRPPRAWAKLRVPPKRLPSALANLPVTGVTWEDASAYARWAGKRLPTEAEWERAARGSKGWPFPYGDRFAPSRIHAGQDGLAPVDTHPDGASDEGVLDLTGNAWEWCQDWFGPYDPGDTFSPQGPASGQARVIRGGYDPSQAGSGSAFHRGYLRPDVANARVGFRCARSVKDSPP